MAFAVVVAVVIIAFGVFWAVVPAKRPADAPAEWTPRTRRSAGAGIAVGGAVLLVLFLLL